MVDGSYYILSCACVALLLPTSAATITLILNTPRTARQVERICECCSWMGLHPCHTAVLLLDFFRCENHVRELYLMLYRYLIRSMQGTVAKPFARSSDFGPIFLPHCLHHHRGRWTQRVISEVFQRAHDLAIESIPPGRVLGPLMPCMQCALLTRYQCQNCHRPVCRECTQTNRRGRTCHRLGHALHFAFEFRINPDTL
jgi:hypothetical protein